MFFVIRLKRIILIFFSLVLILFSIWNNVRHNLHISHSFPTSVFELLTDWRERNICEEVELEWDLSVLAVIWYIWGQRNKRIFQKTERTALHTLSSIHNCICFCLRNSSNKYWKCFTTYTGPKGIAGRRALSLGHASDFVMQGSLVAGDRLIVNSSSSNVAGTDAEAYSPEAGDGRNGDLM